MKLPEPTRYDKKRIHILWRMMPLSDISDRLDIPYRLLVRWQSRGYITPTVRWIDDMQPVRTVERERKVYRLFWEGLDTTEVANRLDIHPSSATRIYNRVK